MRQNQKIIERKYVLYRALANAWFLEAVWLYFYRLYMNDRQAGFLDGLSFGIGLIAEIPSGALADRYGRKKIAVIGQSLVALGVIMEGIGAPIALEAGFSYAVLLIGQTLLMIGVAFVSGADDAMFYEKLGYEEESGNWRRLVSRGAQASIATLVVVVPLGGLLHSVDPSIPWIVTGVMFLCATLILWSVDDRSSVNKDKMQSAHIIRQSFKLYFRAIYEGFIQFFKGRLRTYVLLIIFLHGILYTFEWGILRIILLDRFAFTPFAGAVVMAIASLVSVGALQVLYHGKSRFNEKRVVLLMVAAVLVSLIASAFNIGNYGLMVIVALTVAGSLFAPFVSAVVNTHTLPQYRATAISVASFLKSVPYVVFAPIVGLMSTNGTLSRFFIAWSAVLVLAAFIYISGTKSDTVIEVEQD